MLKKTLYIPPGSDINKNRYILHEGRVVSIPSNPVAALKDPLTRPVPLAVLKDIITPRRPTSLEDESIRDFFGRRFSYHVADQLLSAFIHGIYGGDVSQWSIRAQFPLMWDLESQHRSIAIGSMVNSLKSLRETRQKIDLPRGTGFTFTEGSQMLPDALLEDLNSRKSVKLEIGVECERLESTEGGVSVSSNGKRNVFDQVFVTASAHNLPSLLDGNEVEELSRIPLFSMAPVNLAWKTALNPLKPCLGYLVPHLERQPYTGVIFDSYAYGTRQPPDSTVIAVMFGGPVFQEWFKKGVDKQTLLEEACRILNKNLGITQRPDVIDVSILERCMPQYHVGHLRLIENARRAVDTKFKSRVKLLGASFDGIGVPDCIHQAYFAALQV